VLTVKCISRVAFKINVKIQTYRSCQVPVPTPITGLNAADCRHCDPKEDSRKTKSERRSRTVRCLALLVKRPKVASSTIGICIPSTDRMCTGCVLSLLSFYRHFDRSHFVWLSLSHFPFVCPLHRSLSADCI